MIVLERLLLLLGAAAWAAYLGRLALRSLHILQLEHYQTWRFLRWSLARPARWAPPDRVVSAAASVALAVATAERPGPLWSLLWIGLAILGWRRSQPGPAKKPLVLTARARRLVAGQALLTCLAAVLPAALAGVRARSALMLAAGAAALAAPAATAAANLLLWPVEEAIRRYYLRDAGRRLRECGPTVLAVSGSYGKTSTKEFVATILSARWPTLRPPGSHNTPMGIARVIREQLRPQHTFFVAELGDFVPGDIGFLCDLLHPRIGIFTTIGPEHLERFKSMERIVRSKAELVDALPPGGLAIINADDPLVRSLGERARSRGLRVVTYGLAVDADVRGRGVQTTRDGLRFTVDAGPASVEVQVGLLGRHNVSNLLAAAACALELGMSLDEVADAMASIRPVEHRLQPIQGEGGVLVIDDAFNSNPRGARAALEVLAELDGRRKVLVTPGMVELGPREADENRALARKAASVCDEIILVGHERAEALLQGLRDASFPAERTHVVANLAEAQARLYRMLRAGDVVLFENDLPDQYERRETAQRSASALSSPAALNGRPAAPNANGDAVPSRVVPAPGGPLRIVYREQGVGESRPTVVILHGWGATVEAVAPIQHCLADGFRTIALDLPGFGQSELPPPTWGNREYAVAVRAFLEQHGVRRATLVGHSRGGAISIVLAASYPDLVDRLVLVNSAGLRTEPDRTIRARIAAYRATRRAADLVGMVGGARLRIALRERLASCFGSADYRNAGPMRDILVRMVREDLRELLPRIQAPTLLIWGEQDQETPLSVGQLMEALIPDAGLVVFPSAGHFSYLDDPARFCRVLRNFLRA